MLKMAIYSSPLNYKRVKLLCYFFVFRLKRHWSYRFVVGLLLLELFNQYAPLFVLAALVLKPNPDDSRAKTRHLNELLFHEGVGSRVGIVTSPQGMELFFVEDCPDAGCFLRLLVHMRSKRRLACRNGLCCKKNEREKKKFNAKRSYIMLGKREDYEYIQWSNCHLI